MLNHFVPYYITFVVQECCFLLKSKQQPLQCIFVAFNDKKPHAIAIERKISQN